MLNFGVSHEEGLRATAKRRPSPAGLFYDSQDDGYNALSYVNTLKNIVKWRAATDDDEHYVYAIAL